jgi:hypothetical protein
MQNMRTLLGHVPKLKQGDILLANYIGELFQITMPRITKGRYYLIRGIKDSLFNTPSNPHPVVYDMVLCSKSGKLYKTDFRIACYDIDEKLDNGDFTLTTL